MSANRTGGQAAAWTQQFLNQISSVMEVGPTLDRLPPNRDPLLDRWPNLAPWFSYGIYGLVQNDRTIYLGKSHKPIFAVLEHARPAPAWMGHIPYTRAWVRPSHPDRVARELDELRASLAIRQSVPYTPRVLELCP